MSRGFTLIEVLLSVAILTLLVGLSLPVYETFVRRNDLDITTQSIALAIRRAETYARAVKNDDTWGVEFSGPDITLYKGASYASRTAGYDEIVSLPDSVSISGLSEVGFAKVLGSPSTTGTITLTSTTNDTRTLTLNAEGMVDY